MTVRISVIVPTYNAALFLTEALESALSQVPPPWEVLVQDGGSTDGTISILQRFGERVRWVSESDSGQSDALNRAVEHASGDVMVWLNADDMLLPGALAAAEVAFKSDTDLAFAYGDYDMIEASGKILRRYRSTEYSWNRVFSHGCYIFSGALFIRRRALVEIGAFDSSLRACMDLDLMLRLDRAGRSRHLGTRVAQFRVHGAGKSSTIGMTFFLEAVRVRRRYAGRSPLRWINLVRAALVLAVMQLTSPIRYSRWWPRNGHRKTL